MDYSVGLAQSQRVIKQRNALGIAALVLAALVVILFLVGATRDREIVLQPIARTPLTLSSSGVSEDYLEMVTRDTALMTLMPDQALKRIIAETSAAGGVVVFRGFPGNSGKAFIAAISKVVEKQQQFASIGIDPRLFRAFNVTAVPTYVVSSTDFTPCDGLTCRSDPPPFDSMVGNVTVRYALETFAQENGPGALMARTALANLGRTP